MLLQILERELEDRRRKHGFRIRFVRPGLHLGRFFAPHLRVSFDGHSVSSCNRTRGRQGRHAVASTDASS